MKITDSSRFHLKGTGNRWLHLATIQDSLREFMCFQDAQTQQVYIEEITGGHLEFIKDESLAQELAAFLADAGITHIGRPTIPDWFWQYGKPTQ